RSGSTPSTRPSTARSASARASASPGRWCARTRRLTEADLDALGVVLNRQAEAVAAREKERFHALDEAFHREICERAGLGFAWALVRENKA
ncbi:hypothetical protein CNY89_27960, partial [Amaricoccus sp. HAR-UPW-R2A-40]